MATISSSTNFTVPNATSYDGDMVVKQYTSLTINGGVTVNTNNACKGMIIYVRGDMVLNGTLSCRPSQNSTGGLPSNTKTGVILNFFNLFIMKNNPLMWLFLPYKNLYR